MATEKENDEERKGKGGGGRVGGAGEKRLQRRIIAEYH